ncbi:MAG: hypothetical protein DI620_01980 [Haemophilus parainfluenzae]|nr:MAG: hypothetical protein DI620_01980 [Haemophilus parainfluenzae]
MAGLGSDAYSKGVAANLKSSLLSTAAFCCAKVGPPTLKDSGRRTESNNVFSFFSFMGSTEKQPLLFQDMFWRMIK